MIASEVIGQNILIRYAEDATFLVGESITFEGYADDYGTPVTAIEFSLDGGETWTTYTVDGATADNAGH